MKLLSKGNLSALNRSIIKRSVSFNFLEESGKAFRQTHATFLKPCQNLWTTRCQKVIWEISSTKFCSNYTIYKYLVHINISTSWMVAYNVLSKFHLSNMTLERICWISHNVLWTSFSLKRTQNYTEFLKLTEKRFFNALAMQQRTIFKIEQTHTV